MTQIPRLNFNAKSNTKSQGQISSHNFNTKSQSQISMQNPMQNPKVKFHRIINYYKVKVKSAYEPSGPSGRSLSRFPCHEVTRSISTSPWMGYQSITGLPPAFHRYPFIHLGGERHCGSKMSCPRTQHNVPGQDPNPDHSLQS